MAAITGYTKAGADGKFALATDLVTANTAISQLQSTAATTAELSVSWHLDGMWSGTTYTKTGITGPVYHVLWSAPWAAQIISADIMVQWGSMAQDPANYVEYDLTRRNAAGTAANNIVTKTTADEAITDWTNWSFDGATWNATNATFAKGDNLRLVVTAFGTAVITYPFSLTVRVQPL